MAKKAKKVNSNRKGKAGEREAATFLESLGFGPCRRSQQRSGIETSDVIAEKLPNLHIEVKTGYANGFDVGTALLAKAVEQAERDRADNARAVVLWRPHGCRTWRLTWRDVSGFLLTTSGHSSLMNWLCHLNWREGR